jgi:hypothetical protein
MGRAAAVRLAEGGGEPRHLVLAPTLHVRASSQRTRTNQEDPR